MSLIISTSNTAFGSLSKKNFSFYPMNDSSKITNSFDQDVRTYRNNVVSNGGTISDTSLAAINTFVTTLKNKSLWTKVLDMGVFAGNNMAAAMTKLKYQLDSQKYLGSINFLEADFVETGTNGGLKGDGSTKYLNARFRANQQTNDDSSVSLYHKNSPTTQNVGFGVFNGAGKYLMHPGYSDGKVYIYQYAPAVVLNYTPAVAPIGHLLGTRTNVSAEALYQNGVVKVNAAAARIADLSSTFGSLEFFLLNYNNAGVPDATQYSPYRYCFYHFGMGMNATEVANFYAAVQALQVALNRSV